jgi:hypothetical protein
MKMSKTITIRKKESGYVVTVEGIAGQQSFERFINHYDENGNFVRSEKRYPIKTFVEYCKVVARISCVNLDDIEIVLKSVIKNNFSGYTTLQNLQNNDNKSYLAPVA